MRRMVASDRLARCRLYPKTGPTGFRKCTYAYKWPAAEGVITMTVNRRQFIAGTTALAVGSGSAKAAADTKRIPNRIGVSTYSFWQFKRHEDLRDIEKCLELAYEMGFDGVEILLVQMTAEDNATLQRIKRRAFSLGLDLMGFSTHQSFVKPDADERKQNVDLTNHQIELAYAMGI